MVGGLAAAVVTTLVLGSAPGLHALWWVTGTLATMLASYLGLLAYLRSAAFDERETRALTPLTPLACDWRSSPFLLDRWAITRFLWAGVAGGLLQVVIALTQRMVERRLIGDGSSQAWLQRSIRLQAFLRRQSVRVLFVSATAAAGATAVGSFGSAAAAAPLSATASLPVPPPPSSGRLVSTYTVVAGDTLSALAQRFATTVSALAAANHIADPNLIDVGQVLHIHRLSTGPAGSPASSPDSTYTVVAGDTLDALAQRFATTVSALAAANHIADPNLIDVGQVLVVHGLTTADTSAPTPVASSSPASSSGSSTETTIPPPTTAAPTTAPAGAPAIAVRTALAQVGKPYKWAGAGPNNFDCSGLVMYAWDAAGVSLPHYSVSQLDDTTRISASQLQPGDLVFYGSQTTPQHVDMYIGGGQVVAADDAGTDVRVESINFAGTPSAYSRVA